MPLLSKPFLDRVSPGTRKSFPDAARQLQEIAIKSLQSEERFEIFLSHSFEDANYILKLYEFLTEIEYTVFVDWIEAPDLDRSNVTRDTANDLRRAIKRSDSLLFAASSNARTSTWMSWEAGYADALHDMVAVMPIRDVETVEEAYRGQEYLSLYPYITVNPNGRGQVQLWVNEDIGKCVTLTEWLTGEKPKRLSLFTKALRERTGII